MNYSKLLLVWVSGIVNSWSEFRCFGIYSAEDSLVWNEVIRVVVWNNKIIDQKRDKFT